MRLDSLDNQVVAISGASGSIGGAIALDLAARGAKVVINDYGTDISGRISGDATPAERLVREIQGSGGTACMVLADIGTVEGAAATLQKAIDQYGRIDAIVHAACVFPDQVAFEDLSRADFERVVKVSVHGAWGFAQAAWPHFKAQGYGRVLLIQSAAGFYGRIGMPAYSIAKSSFIGFTNYLAQEGAPHGILVNNISPVASSRASQSEGEKLSYMDTMFPAANLGPLAALMVHPSFDRTNLMLHSGGAVVTRMFIPETRGVAFRRDGFTPETIFARLDEILDEAEYRTPATTDDVGIALFQAVTGRDSGA